MSTFPTRISLLTYNLWKTFRWPEREPALRAFFQRFRPDIFCLQELRRETRTALEQSLPAHRHIEDDFPGWVDESNIFWNAELFDLLEYGCEDIQITSDPLRRFFWARLRVKAGGRMLFVATAHFTMQEHPDELRSGETLRLKQAEATVEQLQRLVQEGEPAFFMGDLNDPVLPTYKLAQAGYQSCFVRLGLVPPPTWPSFPTANVIQWNRLTTQAMDWIVSNQHARPLIASVPQFYHGDFSPSDHWPVLAYYEI